MNRALKSIFITVLLCLLFGCTPIDTALKSWDGYHFTAVIKQLGPPSSKGYYNDQSAYAWHQETTFTLPETYTTNINKVGGSYYATTQKIGGGTISGFCEVIFTVDRKEFINGWAYKGSCSGYKYLRESFPYDEIYKKPAE